MATNPPNAKRPRLSPSCKNSNSTSTDPVVPLAVPDTVSSLSQLPPVALSFNKDSPPTSDNIDSALHTIGVKKKYTDHEVTQSLRDLARWAFADINNQVFKKEFMEFGGIPRLLNFFNVSSNMANMDYVNHVASIITWCTYNGNNGDTIDVVEVMTKKFMERDVIYSMLLANEEYTGGNDPQELRAIYSLWNAFGNIAGNKVTAVNRDTTFRLFDDALATLRLLNVVKNTTLVHDIKIRILNTVAFLVLKNNALINATGSDFEARNFFQTCLDALKDVDGRWDYIENVWNMAARLFYHCIAKKLFSAQNNDNLNLVISFYVEYTKKAPNYAFEAKAFWFLHKARHIIGKNAMIELPGLLITISGILDPTASTDIEDDTKDAAKALMKKLF